MRFFNFVIAISCLIGTGAFADTRLAPGKPAGVGRAQLNIRTLEFGIIAAGIVAGTGIAILTIQGRGHASASSTGSR